MFDFFKKKKTEGTRITLKLSGLHCTSCAMNIDGALEDVEGVLSATTNYAKSEVSIEYLPAKVTVPQITQTIEAQGYQVTQK